MDLSVVGSDGMTVEGKSTYSRKISVEREAVDLMFTYPNPVIDFAEIELNLPVSVSSWTVLDNKGIARKTGKGLKADLSDLSTGQYILKIVTENNDTYYRKVFKK